MDDQKSKVQTSVAVGYAAAGVLIRKKFFARASEALRDDPRKAFVAWKVGNTVGFSCAFSISLAGFALRVLGSDWLAPAIFFGLGLAFLLLWRPRWDSLPF